jgi:hypothetical protein
VGEDGTSVALSRPRQTWKTVTMTETEMYYKPVSRVLTLTEIQLFCCCGEERVATALARLVTLPADASYDMIEQAVIQGLVAMKLGEGGDPRVGVIKARRRDNRRPN